MLSQKKELFSKVKNCSLKLEASLLLSTNNISHSCQTNVTQEPNQN